MKPIISSFIFSEDTQQNQNQGGVGHSLHIINPKNILRPQFIPSEHTFSVSFGIIHLDPESEHLIRFKLLAPSEVLVLDTENISMPKNLNFDKSLPAEANELMFNLDFRNVALREEGMYKGIAMVNDEVMGKFPLLVYPMEPIR